MTFTLFCVSGAQVRLGVKEVRGNDLAFPVVSRVFSGLFSGSFSSSLLQKERKEGCALMSRCRESCIMFN